MQRRDKLTYMILASVVVLGLTLLMVNVDAQARIAFVSDRDGNAEIYVMDADGGNQQRLTNNRHGDASPSWSPDGKRIAFISDRDGHVNIRDSPNYEIYVMDADGGNQLNLTNDPHNDKSPSWSPDGQRIAFVSIRDGNQDIYVMDADGDNQRRLTHHDRSDMDPSWSPDGKRIAFTSGRDINAEIYVMDADGGNQQNLTNHPDADRSPSWSPNGKRIAFVSNRTRDLNPDIFVMDADGSNPRNLTNHPEDEENPAWLNPVLSVSPADKTFTIWGQLKQINR